MTKPLIILLNGTSSAGKSSIAKALQNQLDAPYLHVCIDTFEEMVPNRPEFKGMPVFENMISGFHHSIVALAQCGNNLIVDHVLIENEEHKTWAPECLSLIKEFSVFFVGVHCPLEELERREQERGDRPSGLARWQLPWMHVQTVYDFEVNTSLDSADGCAARIIEARHRTKANGLQATLRALEACS